MTPVELAALRREVTGLRRTVDNLEIALARLVASPPRLLERVEALEARHPDVATLAARMRAAAEEAIRAELEPDAAALEGVA